MAGNGLKRIRDWIRDVFETRGDILAFIAVGLFLIANIVKISLFNQALVPNFDKWMLRYKLIITTLVVIITYPFLFFFRRRAVFITFYILQLVYIIGNLGYYLYFQNYLHIQEAILNFTEGMTAVGNAAGPVGNPLLLLSILDLPFFIFVVILYRRTSRLRKKLQIPIYIAMLLAFFIMGYHQAVQYKARNFLTQLSKNMFVGESRVVQRYGTLADEVMNIYHSGSTADFIKRFTYGKERSNTVEAPVKHNIFIIQVESMDASIVRQQYKGQPVMPFLNQLQGEEIYYPYMMSYHLGGGTSDAEFSVINSIEPLAGYPSIKLSAYQSPNSFVKQLDLAGYTANAFHGNVGRFYDRDMAFVRFGFNAFYDIGKMGMKDVGWGAPDDAVFSFALKKAEEVGSKPSLTYVITMTSHGPFTNAANYYHNAAYDDVPETLVKDYYNSMSYVDGAIRDYVTSIRKEDKDAYIFIFGDHTPKITSDIFKQSAVMVDSKLYEFVPLFILTPDDQHYVETKKAAVFLDLAPTILNAAGVQYRIKTNGSDLLKPGGTDEKIPYRGLSWDREKLFKKITDAMGTEATK